MTYSINVRARTRDDCKQLVAQRLQVQLTGQTGHQHDRRHLETMLYALIDLMPENQYDDIVVDAYGYTSMAGDGSLRMVLVNVKVYAAPRGSVTIATASMPADMTLPPRGTF